MIIVDPSFVSPPPPAVSTASDGILSAMLDSKWAGVYLKADFNGTPEQIEDTNLWPDPDMVTKAAAWTSSGGTVADGPEGGIKLTTTAVGYVIATTTQSKLSGLVGGSKIYITADVRGTGTATLAVQFMQVDANGVNIGNVSVYNGMTPTAGWSRQTFSVTLNAAAVGSTNLQLIRSSAGSAVGDTTEWRKIKVSYSNDSSFFSGATPAAGGLSYRWKGAANASPSEKYVPAQNPLGVMPKRCTFIRKWDGLPVRGGDPALVVSGIARVYEHEAPLSAVSSWYVVPELEDGTILAPTALVPKTVPGPAGGSSDPSTWIKSVDSPSSSVRVMIDSWPAFSYDTAASASRPQGRSNSVVSYDVLSGPATSAKFRTMTAEDADAFFALMEVGGVMLFQTAEKYQRPSFYAVVSTVTREDQAYYWQNQITWTLDLISVDRPDTTDSASSTPGYTFADRLAAYPKFSDVPPRTFADTWAF